MRRRSLSVREALLQRCKSDYIGLAHIDRKASASWSIAAG
jgi:hypothetical protein